MTVRPKYNSWGTWTCQSLSERSLSKVATSAENSRHLLKTRDICSNPLWPDNWIQCMLRKKTFLNSSQMWILLFSKVATSAQVYQSEKATAHSDRQCQWWTLLTVESHPADLTSDHFVVESSRSGFLSDESIFSENLQLYDEVWRHNYHQGNAFKAPIVATKLTRSLIVS